jgi:hypothetical protein
VKCHYRSANNRLTFELDAGSQKDLFEGIATLQEIFESDSTCGMCNSTDLRFRVREVKDNKYYEMRCGKCNAQLSFGQHKTGGTLFPKRTTDEGDMPNRGWYRWQPRDDR